MVDFPEGYGFAPGAGRRVMQESFTIDIGTFARRDSYFKTGRRAPSPYSFTAIGYIRKKDKYSPIFGVQYGVADDIPPIEGTLQQVVTAMCVMHRMRGNKNG